ncbi:hypothetical protein DV711_05750 [Motiliproteus coralliicola]|uniref:Uncharacterized protein n=1 Tax=Motiliproteus coralliicola TaxID=2283196 RepID=A0A369WX03_9GAMM|nr:hypothetical protein [Motiliproteus coralliicola]RDE25064.1 hypothetical protein DV711_05750 [Motiliproteus coralliicola]
MSAEDKLGGYAQGFGSLDAATVAANVTEDYKLLDKDGVIHEKKDLAAYITELKQLGESMEITDVSVSEGKAWCKWKIGDVVGAGLISFGDAGVSEEQLFYH